MTHPRDKILYVVGRLATISMRVVASVWNGETSRPLPHVVRHSPTGLEYGYGGSGPADLALSILTDAYGSDVADRHYQDFKHDVIARADRQKTFSISLAELDAWLHKTAGDIP